jgi:hypothetical protein
MFLGCGRISVGQARHAAARKLRTHRPVRRWRYGPTRDIVAPHPIQRALSEAAVLHPIRRRHIASREDTGMRPSHFFLLAAAIGLGGCSGASSDPGSRAWSCSQSEVVGGVTRDVKCVEYVGLTQDQVVADQVACAGSDAGVVPGLFYASGICLRSGAVGECIIASDGGMVTQWWYPAGGLTTDALKKVCGDSHGTFVAP